MAKKKGTAKQRLADRIRRCRPLFRLMEVEGLSLRAACERVGTPKVGSVMDYLHEHPTIAEQYARARERRADYLHERMIEVATTTEEGSTTKDSEKDGITTTTGDMIEHRRLVVDTYKWVLGRMHANRFGDKVKQEISGPEGAPVQVEHSAAPKATEALNAFATKLAAMTGTSATAAKP